MMFQLANLRIGAFGDKYPTREMADGALATIVNDQDLVEQEAAILLLLAEENAIGPDDSDYCYVQAIRIASDQEDVAKACAKQRIIKFHDILEV